MSRVLPWIGGVAAGERAATVAGVVVAAWIAAYAIAGFPAWMATALMVVASALTLVMVFVIQHTQRRLECATQLKLDELVRASDADDAVAEIEVADDDELERQRARKSAVRSTATR
jgi:low affinity Fe/Cu permease